MKSRTLLAAVFAVALAAAPAAAQGLTGTWELSTEGRGGPQTMTLVLEQDGESLTGTLTRMFGRRGGGSFRLAAYRVYVEDGREEPARGLSFEGLGSSTLRDIVAAGETKHVGHSGRGAASSICAPAVVVEELDLRKPPPQTAKKPYMEKPEF